MAWADRSVRIIPSTPATGMGGEPAPAGSRATPRVMIAIPHRLGDWTADFVHQTYLPLKAEPSRAFDRLFMLCRTASITAARNMLVAEALKAQASHVFFLDCDIILPEPVKAIEALLGCNEPIVSGIYRRKSREGYEWCMFTKVPELGRYAPITQWTGNWISADVIGMGCCLIRTEVFRKVEPPWFVWHDPDAPSEDFAFCEKARAAGFEVKVFTEVQAAHVGTFKLMPDGSFKMLEV